MRRRQFRIAAVAAGLGWGVAPAVARAQVSGQVTVADAGGRSANDVGNAVVYLEGHGPRGAPVRVDISLDGRSFSPRVVVVPVGSTVVFPNRDPFNHNVFSLSDPNSFDLGLYGRGEAGDHRFRHPGLVRVYCNIHPQMSGFIVVRDNAYFAQPGADGSYTIPSVAPGAYTLHVWHERAPEVTRQITVPAGGLAGVDVSLDASAYHAVAHKNKYGEEYGSGATRERY
ncbi:MAG TPA: carboxypeptidase regulatory-like domain-containing protein [Gemmatimonadales bacterium]|nr:carboxypeptidase regulatory-like domain-containing protein [Gemmatimonadales bacterium]